MAGDLASITGLKPKHLATLTDTLGLVSPVDLYRADRRDIHKAMRRLKPRPTLEEISTWQDEARDLSSGLTSGSAHPGWETAAAFAISFEQREAGGADQRRTVVEQAERSPSVSQEWPEWRCDAACAWMLERLGVTEPPAAAGPTPAGEPAPLGEPAPAGPTAAEPGPTGQAEPTGQPEPAPSRPAIAVSKLQLVLPGGARTGLDRAEAPTADVPPDARLSVVVTGPPAGQDVRVALRLRLAGGGPIRPVTARAGTPAELDLTELPTGEHDAVLAAWSDDGSVAPVVVPLPRLRVGAGTA